MGYTSPQLRLLNENKKALFKKFTRMIQANPNSLLQILDDARGMGFREPQLIELLAYAHKTGSITLDQYKKYAARYDKAKTGRIRRTGRVEKGDTALISDKGSVGEVTCAFCKDSVPAHRADLVGGGAWMCNICSGS